MKTLVQSAIAQHLPELAITLNTTGSLFGKFSWNIRGVESENIPGGENGFENEAEALAHFSKYLLTIVESDAGEYEEDDDE